MVFDLLRLFGSDLTTQPWSARRACSTGSTSTGRHWQVPEVYDDGPQLLAATLEQGLEGIVSKRRSAPYCPGAARRLAQDRPPDHPVGRRRRLAPGGRHDRAGSAPCSSACPTAAAAGGMPAGWARASPAPRGDALAQRLRPLHRDRTRPSSTRCPRIDANGTTWVEPARGRRGAHPRGDRATAPAAPAGIPRRAHRPEPGRPARRSTMPEVRARGDPGRGGRAQAAS